MGVVIRGADIRQRLAASRPHVTASDLRSGWTHHWEQKRRRRLAEPRATARRTIDAMRHAQTLSRRRRPVSTTTADGRRTGGYRQHRKTKKATPQVFRYTLQDANGTADLNSLWRCQVPKDRGG